MPQILDVIKGQAVSLANHGFKKVTGGLRGVISSSLDRRGAVAPKYLPDINKDSFTFPLDVINDDLGLGNHGHYIIFSINRYTNATVSFGNKKVSGKSFDNAGDALRERGEAEFTRSFINNPFGGTRGNPKVG